MLTQEEVANLFATARQESTQSEALDRFRTASLGLSPDNLFSLLKAAGTMEEATAIEKILKLSWMAHRNPEYYFSLVEAADYYRREDFKKSLAILKELVRDDPTYAEAWNLLSSCQYALGFIDKSFDSAERVLKLEPNHYEALSHMGVVAFLEGSCLKAASIFRKSLELHPWTNADSKLRGCLHFSEAFDDEGSEEGEVQPPMK